jgi:transposase
MSLPWRTANAHSPTADDGPCGAHTAQGPHWPAHGQDVRLTPYGPELGPLERVWRDVKDDVAWRQFPA